MFGSKEIKRLKAEVRFLENESGRFRQMAENGVIEKESLTKQNDKLAKDVAELKKMVREQTQADLLINALKAIGAMPDPDKTDYRTREQALVGRLAALQNMGMTNTQGLGQAAPYTNLFGGIF